MIDRNFFLRLFHREDTMMLKFYILEFELLASFNLSPPNWSALPTFHQGRKLCIRFLNMLLILY